MRNSILTAMICGLFCGVGSAQQNSSDRFFVVASKNRKVLTNLGAPSVNDRGDLVLRLISGTVKTHEVCLGEDQLNPANQPGVVPLVLVRSSSGTLSTYPVLNNNRSVVSYNYQSSIQTVSRYDYSNTPSPQFFSARIARADAAQTQPFAFLSPIADLDDSGNVFFSSSCFR